LKQAVFVLMEFLLALKDKQPMFIMIKSRS